MQGLRNLARSSKHSGGSRRHRGDTAASIDCMPILSYQCQQSLKLSPSDNEMIDVKTQITSVPPDQLFSWGQRLRARRNQEQKPHGRGRRYALLRRSTSQPAPMHIYGSPPDLPRPEETLEYDRTTANGPRSARSHLNKVCLFAVYSKRKFQPCPAHWFLSIMAFHGTVPPKSCRYLQRSGSTHRPNIKYEHVRRHVDAET